MTEDLLFSIDVHETEPASGLARPFPCKWRAPILGQPRSPDSPARKTAEAPTARGPLSNPVSDDNFPVWRHKVSDPGKHAMSRERTLLS